MRRLIASWREGVPFIAERVWHCLEESDRKENDGHINGWLC